MSPAMVVNSAFFYMPVAKDSVAPLMQVLTSRCLPVLLTSALSMWLVARGLSRHHATVWMTSPEQTSLPASRQVIRVIDAMQMWLQAFAWSEKGKPNRLEARDRATLYFPSIKAEPMFCFETACKLFYWSALIYKYSAMQEVRRAISIARVTRPSTCKTQQTIVISQSSMQQKCSANAREADFRRPCVNAGMLSAGMLPICRLCYPYP